MTLNSFSSCDYFLKIRLPQNNSQKVNLIHLALSLQSVKRSKYQYLWDFPLSSWTLDASLEQEQFPKGENKRCFQASLNIHTLY